MGFALGARKDDTVLIAETDAGKDRFPWARAATTSRRAAAAATPWPQVQRGAGALPRTASTGG